MITARLLWRVECNECAIPILQHGTPQFEMEVEEFGEPGEYWIPDGHNFWHITYTGTHFCDTCQAKLKPEQTK